MDNAGTAYINGIAEMKKIRFIDLFGGIGGFRLGLEKASDRFECVWYNDNNKYAVQIYNKRFGENHEPKDIRKIKTEEIPDFDMLCAGFPCQSFSIAGRRKGFADTRGTLFFEIARIAKGKQPKYLLLENVKGLLSHEQGETFRTILRTLDELGYDAEWQVLNSKYFGVPQNRERVFIIGHLRGESSKQIFPIFQINKKSNQTSAKSRKDGSWIYEYHANTIAQRDHKGGNQVLVIDVQNSAIRDECPTLTDPCHNTIRLALKDDEDEEE